MNDDLAREVRLIESAMGRHLFVVDGSRIYDVGGEGAISSGELRAMVDELVSMHAPRVDGSALEPPALQTLSLNIAQACNMGCGYCYADEGKFGGKARRMAPSVARLAVDRLLMEAAPGAPVTVGFMGGEPFLNRELLHDIVPYAVQAAAEAGHAVTFSITTNATLLKPADIRLLAANDFHVTVSLDGPPTVNDRQRRLLRGGSSAQRVLETLALFERHGRPRHLSARATITPIVAGLSEVLDYLIQLGFDSVGFAPVLHAPDPELAFGPGSFDALLNGMRRCGERAKAHLLARQRYPFTNFETALQQLERGTHRPYPCGAGAAYLSVNTEGELFACHRLVDAPQHRLGDIQSGSDLPRRRLHLARQHVDNHTSCRDCWARYLCGGGCYHEVEQRGRVACDYIRGWLEFCISAYAEIKHLAPDYFIEPGRYFEADTRRACRRMELV